MSYSFGKLERLKGKKTVSVIFDGPKDSVSSFPFRAFFRISFADNSKAQFGVSVPKKKFKRAVDRNQIKRLVKEVIRLNKSSLNEVLEERQATIKVMMVCSANEMPNYSIVEIKIKEILKRLVKEVQAYEEK